MYESVVLKKLRNDEPVWCAKTNLTDPNMVEIMGYMGVHCLWICMEHGAIDFESVHNQVRTCKMTGMDSMIRVAKGSYSDFIRPFEMDATGIMVPHCMSGEEAAEIVKQTRFQPIGRRALDSGNSDGPFCMRAMPEYTRFANEQRFVVAQIEDKESVECMEDIVRTENIDLFFLGPGDLSHSYGVPGEIDDPRVTGAIEKLAELCRKYDRQWGLPCGPDKAREMIDKGARFLAYGSDVTIVTAAFRNIREAYREAGLGFSSGY
jgi:4-hydroxy-2-oxoheptanedioate aldolase